MNKLITKIFEDNGGRFRVRALEIENEPWFVAVDVCTNIGLSNTTESVKALDEDEKGTLRISEGGPEVNIITEAGLYSLVIRSNKPEAKLFKRWVTHEVIPSIRKTGSYSVKPQCVEDLIIMQAQSMKELRGQVSQLTGTIGNIKEAVISEPDNWRADINRKLNTIAKSLGVDKFKEVRSESYKKLEQRAGVDLGRRLDNKRLRMLKEGMSKTAINQANKIDIIDSDKKLREIYGKIVSEYLIKYVA